MVRKASNFGLKSALHKARRVAVHLGLSLVIVAVSQAKAVDEAHAQQRRGLSLVRDAEIEALVADYARPLMKAAGLRRGSVSFHLVNDPALNAFVSGTGLYLYTGLLLQTESPGEVVGVIAHELGHVVGGHQLRLRQRIQDATRMLRLTTLLGMGIGAAASVAGSNSGTAAGLAIASGAPGVVIRDLLRYQRDEEASADRTAATLLRKSKQSGRGMLRTFERLAQDVSIMGGRVDPYLLSHPAPNDRIAAMGHVLRSSPYFESKTNASLRLRHDMVRAKIAAYVGGSRYAHALLAGDALAPQARLYGRAIVAHLYGSPKKALPLIDQLIRQQPRNAYAHEMKGEILLRSGKAAAAVAPFRTAVKLDRTNAGFIRVELGHALIESGNPKNLKEGIAQLRRGLASDPTAVSGYQYLAIAYGRQGDTARALLAAAELAVRTGKKQEARQYARRAQQSFKRGSPEWLRAEDVITYR